MINEEKPENLKKIMLADYAQVIPVDKLTELRPVKTPTGIVLEFE